MKHAEKIGLFGRYDWLALGTLAATTLVASSRLAIAAVAKDGGAGTSGEHAAVGTLPVKRFNIAAGPLDAAIAEYERTTGLTVTSTLSLAALASLQTKGVTGLYPEAEGFRRLLEGTGLSYTLQDAATIVVGVGNTETVDVTATLPDGVSMSKFTESLIDTPQTVSVVPKFVLEEQANHTLEDALRNVPGISLAAGEAGAQGDNLTIRGFTARNDIFLDGIRDFGSYYRDSFDYEQVDVLEGPAGVQFGRGSTGGVINQESKTPLSSKLVDVQTQFGTDLTRRITVDINEPLPDVAGGTGFRLNAMATEAGVAGRPYAELRRFGIAPSIEVGMNSPTRLTLSYFHLTESDTPDYGLPWFNNKLAPGPIRHNYYGFPDANDLKTHDDVITARLDHDFTPNINLHSMARAANYPRQAQITEPQICSNAPASVPVGGYVAALPTSAYNTSKPCPYTPATAPAQIVVNRNQIQVKSVEGDLWEQTEATLRFQTAGIRHTLVVGGEGGQEISNPIRYSYTINNINTVAPTTLLDPNVEQVFGGTGYVTSIVHTKSKSASGYFLDTIHIGELFELSGGVRYDYFDTTYNLQAPPVPAGGTVTAAVAPLDRVDQQPTYRAAFVYKPNHHGSVYFDYGTSFNPSAESLSLSVSLASSDLKPEENETYEIGSKWSFLNDRLKMEGALFRTEKDNARETSATNSQVTVNAGNQVVKGVQVSLVGRLPQETDLVAGYAYLDSAVIASPNYATSVGYPLANVPKQTFNLFVTHRLPARLNFGLGANYVGSRTASSTVPYVPLTYGPLTTYTTASGAPAQGYQVLSVGMKQVPGYWVFNAMLKRPLTDKLELQANVYNLLNRYYIDLPHPSHLIPGAGASALIGLNFKF
jgi:catecholate siderophore receptor